MLHINDITLRLGPRVLFDQASAALPEGARIGLVGRNGTGKTTLFRMIADEMAPDAGSLTLPKHRKLGRVEQEAPGGPGSLIDFVLAADIERARLTAEAETADDPHRIADIQTRLVDIEAHAAPARAARILAGLGFDFEAQARPLSSFSGGWRMRVALAAVLFAQPDLLLLDEPTNYLDLEGTLWLIDYLQRYPATIIVISHDRDMLDAVCDHILHLNHCKLTLWTGNYSSFERDALPVLQQANAKFRSDLTAMLAQPVPALDDGMKAQLASLPGRIHALIDAVPGYQHALDTWSPARPVPWYAGLVDFFANTRWLTASSWQDYYGIVPLLVGSLLISGVALVIAVPLGVGAGIYINQIATPLGAGDHQAGHRVHLGHSLGRARILRCRDPGPEPARGRTALFTSRAPRPGVALFGCTPSCSGRFSRRSASG